MFCAEQDYQTITNSQRQLSLVFAKRFLIRSTFKFDVEKLQLPDAADLFGSWSQRRVGIYHLDQQVTQS